MEFLILSSLAFPPWGFGNHKNSPGGSIALHLMPKCSKTWICFFPCIKWNRSGLSKSHGQWKQSLIILRLLSLIQLELSGCEVNAFRMMVFAFCESWLPCHHWRSLPWCAGALDRSLGLMRSFHQKDFNPRNIRFFMYNGSSCSHIIPKFET